MRRLARASVVDYARSIEIPGAPVDEDKDDDSLVFTPAESAMADHHLLLLRELEKVANTRYGSLMVIMPPGSAKTTYASVVWPSYYLGQRTNSRIIHASYGDVLARKIGRRVRSVIKQKRYDTLWQAQLSRESSAAHEFSLTNGSEYMGGGILTGINGNRAHGLIIDDPVKGRRDANSEIVRETTWGAYKDDLLTRLVPGGWVLLIQTRWHEDDLAGRILPEKWNGESGVFEGRDGRTWTVLCIQAKCEQPTDPLGRQQGEYLWPEWFDAQHWKQFETAPITWSSLFQGVPAPAEGSFFKPDKIEIIDALPKDMQIRWRRGWDLGASKDDGAFTAGARLGIMPSGKVVIGDVKRGQWATDDRDEIIRTTTVNDGYATKQDLPQDPGQAGKSQVLHFTRLLHGYVVETSPESGDKWTRAEPFAAQVNAGNVVMLRGDWNQACLDEMRMAPAGKHKDQIDAMSRAYSGLMDLSSLATWSKLGQ